MLNILYEDEAVLVVWKPVGMESQSGRGFDADMVSAGFAGFIALVLLLITTGSKTKFSNITVPAGFTPPAARNLTSDVSSSLI